jgi:hypothetical protein
MNNSIWIARDEDGDLLAFASKPVRSESEFFASEIWTDVFDEEYSEYCEGTPFVQLPKHFYPEVTWENSPVELKTSM